MPDEKDVLSKLGEMNGNLVGVIHRIDLHEHDCKSDRELTARKLEDLNAKVDAILAWKTRMEYVIWGIVTVLVIEYAVGFDGISRVAGLFSG